MTRRTPWRYAGLAPLPQAAVVAAGLVLALVLAVVSVAFAPADSDVASWWPAAAVAAGLLLVGGRWRILLPALLATTALANLIAGRPPDAALAFGFANATEAAIVAWVLTQGRRQPPRMDDLRDALRLLVGAVAGAVLFGLLAGATVTVFLGGSLTMTAQSTTASHLASNLVILPVLLMAAFAEPGVDRRGAQGTWREGGAQVVVLSATVGVVFAPGQGWPLAFAVFPALVWAALRFAPIVATLEVLAVSVAVSVLTAEGGGPFGARLADGSSPAEVGALVQIFLAALAVVAIPLALSADQRRRSTAALAEASRLTDAVLDNEAAIVLVLDADLVVVRANAVAASLGGPGCAPGRHAAETGLLGVDRAGAAALVDRIQAVVGGVETTLRRDASPRTLLWSGRAVELPGSRHLHVLTALDVTHHRFSEGFLRQVMDATTGTLVAGVDPAGRVTFWNAGAEALLGCPSRRAVGRPLAEFLTRPRATGEATDGTSLPFDLARLGPGGREDWEMSAGGPTRLMSVTVDAMRAVDGELLGFVAVGKDVTERRRTEAGLAAALERERQSAERLAEANAIKDGLVASVSHELRTPLTNVLGYADLLRRDGSTLSEEHRQWVQRIHRNGSDLLALIEDLLLTSQVESATATQQADLLDLGPLVTASTTLVAEHLVQDAGVLDRDRPPVSIEVSAGQDLWVHGDGRQLERAVRNVVANAVKYSPAGGAVAVRCARSGAEVVLGVRDRGIGMSPEEVRRACEPFFRGSSAREAHIGGTGLGLGIVRSVVEAHGGGVHIESELGRGTEVTLRLPAASPRSAAVPGPGPGHDESRDATCSSRVADEKGLTR